MAGRTSLLIPLLSVLALLIALYAQPPSDVSFPPLVSDGTGHVLLVTAHPDDECMFFAPTILQLVKQGTQVSVLCLSIGDADGLGEVRRAEIKEAGAILGMGDDDVHVVDHPHLQDSITVRWPPSAIRQHVQTFLFSNEISLILTFDERGVSSHPNHVSLPLALANQTRFPPVYTLHSSSLLQKYTSFFSPLLPQLPHAPAAEHPRFVSNAKEYKQAVSAMLAHRSQMVWFRWLYIAFSRYMWVNEWSRLEPPRLSKEGEG